MRNMISRSNAPKPPLNLSGGVIQTAEKKAVVCTPLLNLRGGWEGVYLPPLNVKRGRGGVKVLLLLAMALLLCSAVVILS